MDIKENSDLATTEQVSKLDTDSKPLLPTKTNPEKKRKEGWCGPNLPLGDIGWSG